MIEREQRGAIAVVKLAHGKASALDLELLDALEATFADEASSGARAVVLTGTGSIFSAGVDLRRVVDGGKAYLERFLPALDRALLQLARFEKPLVAAVNGHAIAGGAILAFASDRRLLARGKATFGVPELRVGVPFPLTALEIVRAAVGPERYGELILSGRIHTADECLRYGFVEELVEPAELLPRALTIAEDLAALPPRAFAHTKRLLRRPMLERFERDLARDAAAIMEHWTSPEVMAAVRGYVERTLGG